MLILRDFLFFFIGAVAERGDAQLRLSFSGIVYELHVSSARLRKAFKSLMFTLSHTRAYGEQHTLLYI